MTGKEEYIKKTIEFNYCYSRTARFFIFLQKNFQCLKVVIKSLHPILENKYIREYNTQSTYFAKPNSPMGIKFVVK